MSPLPSFAGWTIWAFTAKGKVRVIICITICIVGLS